MKWLDLEQGSPEWKAARAGKVTASRIRDVLAEIKTGEAAARRDYRVELVTEIMTSAPAEDGFVSSDMAWGTEQEPKARSAYEVLRGQLVDEVGFALHPTIERAGCSPDGLIGWQGGDSTPAGIVQIKCPKSATHLGYILDGRVPAAYQAQMLWEMACTGATWCDFVSYDPRVPEGLRLFVRRFQRDDKRILEITQKVIEFLGEVEAMVTRLEEAGKLAVESQAVAP